MLLGLLTARGKIFVKWDYGVCSPWSLKANILDSLFCRFLSEAIVFVDVSAMVRQKCEDKQCFPLVIYFLVIMLISSVSSHANGTLRS